MYKTNQFKIPSWIYFTFLFLFLSVLIVAIARSESIRSILGISTINTSLTVSDTAPAFAPTGTPYEIPESYSGTPINVGTTISFYATGIDPEGDDYYLAVCKTDAVNPGNNSAPVCPGGNWCITTLPTTSGSAVNCSYDPIQSDGEGPNPWYAFVCDKISGGGMCSASHQGSGNSGSPFYVNRKPAFSQLTDDGGTGVDSGANPGGTITFTATASDSDIDFTADTVKLYVCGDNNGASSGGCAGTQLCASSSVTSNPTCNYSVPTTKDNGNYSYYGYIFDSHGLGATSNPINGSYAINNVAPVVTNVSLNGGSTIHLTEDTTTVVNVTATVTDANSCVDISGVIASIYRSPAYDYAACDNQATEGNTNHCYAETTCTVVGGSCTGNTDNSANYTCAVTMQFNADPTTGDGTDPTDPSWWNNTWKATVKANSGGLPHYIESETGVEVAKTLGINITSSISYGNLNKGVSTGITQSTDSNRVTPVEATGNVGVDLGFSGTAMCTSFTPPDTCGGNTIAVGNQKYAYNVTQFNYATEGTALTQNGLKEQVNIPKTINSVLKANKLILWGINVPNDTAVGSYSGQNTLTAYMSESAYW